MHSTDFFVPPPIVRNELSAVLYNSKSMKDLRVIAKRLHIPLFTVMTKTEVCYSIALAVEDLLSNPPAATLCSDETLNDLTVHELKTMLKSKGISSGKLAKQQLITLAKQQQLL